MINIDHIAEEKLLNLNQCIVERLKVLEQMRALQSIVKLNIGKRVCFIPMAEYARTGTIIKFIIKS